MSDDTYPMPAHGWTCYHCGDHFPGDEGGMRAARYHFGPTPDWTPDCIERKTMGRDQLLEEARRSRIASTDFLAERDKALEAEEIAEGHASDWRNALGKRWDHPHDLKNHVHSVEGRALAAEAVLIVLQTTAPDALLAARIAVAGRAPTTH